jgi:acyl carrier protein
MAKVSEVEVREMLSGFVGLDKLVKIGNTYNLFELKVLDSLSTLILLETLDSEFGISFEDQVVNPESICSIELIQKLINGQA